MKNRFLVDNVITNDFVDSLTKTTYKIVGKNKHSAIKPCYWLEQRLMTGRDNRNCYKGVFGVQSHRCLQNTPSLPFCTHQCVFCWRDIENGNLGNEFKVESDDPKFLVSEMIKYHQDIVENQLSLRRYIDNYEIMIDLLYYMLLNKGFQNIKSLSSNLHISKNKVERAINLLRNQKFIRQKGDFFQDFQLDTEIRNCIDSREEIKTLIHQELTTPDEIAQAHSEALNPTHAAISLDGEPLLYPKMSGLVEEFKKRKMTTFIVTNGTLPEKIEELDPLPSQLYVTLPAYDECIYKKICRPTIKNGWEKIMKTLELLQSLSCRTLVRLTAVKGLGISNEFVKEYAKIVEKTNPNFFEIKGFTLQAKALLIRERLQSDKLIQDYFPDYEYLENIALKFEEISNFPLIYKNKTSRDFLFAVNWNKDRDPKIERP